MLGRAVHEQRTTRRDRVDLTTAKLQQRVAGKRHAAAQHACGAEPAAPATTKLASLVLLPLIVMLPVLLRLAAVSVLAALSPLLPICTKLLLVSVPGTDRLVPPLPNPSSTCSSPDTDRLPLGLTDTPLRRNSRPAMLLSPVSALLLLVSEASATCSAGLSMNSVPPDAIVLI